MNSNILFGSDEVESITIRDESIYFYVDNDISLWSVGDDGYEEQDSILSELGIYNIQ